MPGQLGAEELLELHPRRQGDLLLLQPGQPGRDAARRKVLGNAVILVPPAVFACLRDAQVADRTHPRLQVVIHAWKIADDV